MKKGILDGLDKRVQNKKRRQRRREERAASSRTQREERAASSRTQSFATNIVNRLNDISIKIEKKIKEIEVPETKDRLTSIQSPNINNIIKTLNESFVTINKLDKKSISNIINILNNSFKKISEQNKENSDDPLEQFFNKLQKNTTDEGNKLKLHLVSAMEYFITHDRYSTDKESSQYKYINKRIAEIKPSNSNSEPEISKDIKDIFENSFNSTINTVAA